MKRRWQTDAMEKLSLRVDLKKYVLTVVSQLQIDCSEYESQFVHQPEDRRFYGSWKLVGCAGRIVVEARIDLRTSAGCLDRCCEDLCADDGRAQICRTEDALLKYCGTQRQVIEMPGCLRVPSASVEESVRRCGHRLVHDRAIPFCAKAAASSGSLVISVSGTRSPKPCRIEACRSQRAWRQDGGRSVGHRVSAR
jgi:hypothetical protein